MRPSPTASLPSSLDPVSLPTAAESPPLDVQSLYSDHHRWLGAWLRYRLGNSADADDIAQDTFVQVLRAHARQQLERIHEPRAYLSTVAGRLVANFFRRRAIESAYEEVLASQPEGFVPSLEEQALITETLIELDALLDGLGPKVKQAFLLAHCEGMPYADIAKTLGVSLRSVKYYIARAMAQCCLLLP